MKQTKNKTTTKPTKQNNCQFSKNQEYSLPVKAEAYLPKRYEIQAAFITQIISLLISSSVDQITGVSLVVRITEFVPFKFLFSSLQ